MFFTKKTMAVYTFILFETELANENLYIYKIFNLDIY